MKTAMQELIDEIKEAVPYFKMSIYQENFDKALEKEKKQIEKAFEIGYNEGCSYMYDNGNDLKNGEQYYNQTYNQNN